MKIIWWQIYFVHDTKDVFTNQGLYSLSWRTSSCEIMWSLDAAILGVIMIASLCYLTGVSSTLLSMSLSNFRAIGKVRRGILRLPDFARSCGKESTCSVTRSPNYIILKADKNAQEIFLVYTPMGILLTVSYLNHCPLVYVSMSWVIIGSSSLFGAKPLSEQCWARSIWILRNKM